MALHPEAIYIAEHATETHEDLSLLTESIDRLDAALNGGESYVPAILREMDLYDAMREGYRRTDEIIPGFLFLGPRESRRHIEELRINVVISCVLNAERNEMFGYRTTVPDDVMEWKCVIDDDRFQLLSFETVADVGFKIRAARDAGQRVLIHCAAGRSRSVSMVIGYLLGTNHSPTVGAALAFIRTKRSCASPNPGFMTQLQAMETDLVGFLADD